MGGRRITAPFRNGWKTMRNKCVRVVSEWDIEKTFGKRCWHTKLQSQSRENSSDKIYTHPKSQTSILVLKYRKPKINKLFRISFFRIIRFAKWAFFAVVSFLFELFLCSTADAIRMYVVTGAWNHIPKGTSTAYIFKVVKGVS